MDFSHLYETYARDVHRFALFLSGDPALAEDLTAETFARALVGRDALRMDTVKAYLLAIARNLYRDLQRRERRLVPLDDAGDPVDLAPSSDTASENRRRLRDVLTAMQQLPAAEREALALAIDRELPYERIGAILGCSTAAVKVRIHRARVKLRDMVDAKEQRR